jgi:probable O-glycosylation ligase (exosortase A-associated)
MWTVMSLLNPHAFAWTVTDEFPWAEAVAIPTLAGLLLFGRGWNHLLNREVGLLVTLWIWFTFTSVYNSHQPQFLHFAADTWYLWRMVSKILLMTLVTIVIVNTAERFRTLMLVIAGCFAILVLKAVPFMITTAGVFRLYGPPGSMLADNNDFGLALNMTLPMFFFLARIDPSRRVRRIMTITFLATIPAILFTYSRGALVGMAIVLLLMIMRLPQRFFLMPILLLAAAFAVYCTPENWQDRMDFMREGAVIDDSAMSRLNAWTYCWRLAMDYPLTGAGFEAFTPTLFYKYAPNPKDVHGPHSVYFGVLAEHGFPGLFLYLSVLISSFLTLRRIRKEALYWEDEQAAGYAMMLQMGFVGFMVSGAFLGRAYFDYYFTLVACTVVLSQVWRLERTADSVEEPVAEAIPA